MFTKLKIWIFLVLLSAIFIAGYFLQNRNHQPINTDKGESSTLLWFASAADTKSWFSKKYSKYEVFENQIDSLKLYSFYGLKGSGIQRVDAYFYACDSSGCSLLGMKSNTEAKNLSDKATVVISNSKLLIESTNNFKFEFDINK
jgi:hypothetical protein